MITREAKIHLYGPRGTIEVDGTPLEGVTAFTLSGSAKTMPRLELELLVHEVGSTARGVEVVIPDATRDALVALGWTPPEEA